MSDDIVGIVVIVIVVIVNGVLFDLVAAIVVAVVVVCVVALSNICFVVLYEPIYARQQVLALFKSLFHHCRNKHVKSSGLIVQRK